MQLQIRKLFSDLKVQVFLAIMIVGIISATIPLVLVERHLISYEQFDYSSTAAFSIGSFIAVLVITIRSKIKETQSPDNSSQS
jgi:hypothetical protein